MSKPRLRDQLFIYLQYCLPQHALSRLVGYLAASKIPWLKDRLIKTFSHFFAVDMSEAIPNDPEKYASFNEFFTRPLKPGARPIDPDPTIIVSPADGAISELGLIQNNPDTSDSNSSVLIQAKGHYYSLQALLANDKKLTEQFANGAFATIYLSPKDYHRVHMPFTGTLTKTIYVPGNLFSVNQTTANNVPGLFARNERLICIFDTAIGPMAVILVGAMIVAGIETVWGGQVAPQPKSPTHMDISKPITLAKGDEMGRFKLGSTAIVLFPKDTASWNNTLSNGSAVRLGESLGNINI